MPNIEGWSVRDVLKLKQILSLQLFIKGNGFVSNQSIVPGKLVKTGDYLNITLSEPNKPVIEEDVTQAQVNDGTITPLD
jgi:penicillin-binding protein 2B